MLRVPASAAIPVGRLGSVFFPAGYYVYVGSALGGLARRLDRHLTGRGKIRWHIDYLRPLADEARAYAVTGAERQECALAAALARLPGARLTGSRFGASDCRCPGHLVWFASAPQAALLALGLHSWPFAD